MEARCESIRRLLSEVPLFECLERSEIERVAGRSMVIDLKRGALLFRQGGACVGLHVVMQGQVKLALDTARGGEAVLEILGPGSTCGEESVFLGAPYLATAEALCDSAAVRIPGEFFRDHVSGSASMSERLIGQLCQRLRRRTLDFGNQVGLSGTQRVVTYLLEQRPLDCCSSAVTLALRAKKGVIASRLNLTPAHFSRILHGLSEAGLIEVQGRDVRLIDIERLQSYAAE
jgi:CRP-like cAMP-binding protein